MHVAQASTDTNMRIYSIDLHMHIPELGTLCDLGNPDLSSIQGGRQLCLCLIVCHSRSSGCKVLVPS